MRKASTVASRQTVHSAQFFRQWLYPLNIVSMVTIIRGNGARAAGVHGDHESFERW
jgi:hypothetical protein